MKLKINNKRLKYKEVQGERKKKEASLNKRKRM
jgi:hypothetical protein